MTDLICLGDRDAGIFLSSFPQSGWLSEERLRERRSDLIYVNIQGNPDGSSAVDYTVNPASGFPLATGPSGTLNPTNHVLPAWDIAAGLTAASSLLAAERHRTRTGLGGLVTVALADVAFAMVANLGFLAQTQLLGESRPPIGNDMYGAFGRDFVTADGRRIMVVAISLGQWRALTTATKIDNHLPALEHALGLDFSQEGDRFRGRDALAALIAPWVGQRTLDEVRSTFTEHSVCWGPYQTFRQLADEDWRCSAANPLFGDVVQPGVGTVLSPGSTAFFGSAPRVPPMPAPVLGQHTDEILLDELGLSAAEVGRLHDRGIVSSPQEPL